MEKKSVNLCVVALLALTLGACASTHREESGGMGPVSESEQSGEMGGTSDAASVGSSTHGNSHSGSSSEQMGGTAANEVASTPFSREQLVAELTLNELHHLNQKEIQMAQLAQEKAESAQVKQHAQRVLTDHQNLETRVQEVAESKNVKLQDFQPSTYEKAVMDRLRSLSGKEFDMAFNWNMKDGHHRAIQTLRMQRKTVKDPQITSLISQAIPKMRQHAKPSSSKQSRPSGDQMGGEVGDEIPDDSQSMPQDQSQPVAESSQPGGQ